MNAEHSPSSSRAQDARLNEETDATSLEDMTLPDRRRFFGTFVKESITAVCTARVACTPGLELSYLFFKGSNSERATRKPYPFTNEWTEIQPGLGFHNIGVQHTGKRFLLDRELLLAAIEKHDVVLLEGCRGQEYFDHVAALAHHLGKQVVRLESDISLVPGVAITVVPMMAVAVAAHNMAHYGKRALAGILNTLLSRTLSSPQAVDSDSDCDDGAESDAREPDDVAAARSALASRIAQLDERTTWRRAFLTALTAGGVEVFGILHSLSNMEQKPRTFHHDDWSYTVDGRTVLMLGEVEKFLLANRDVSALCITGDAHARGFSAYMRSPEDRELYTTKLAKYRRMYKPIFGGNATVESDPANS